MVLIQDRKFKFLNFSYTLLQCTHAQTAGNNRSCRLWANHIVICQDRVVGVSRSTITQKTTKLLLKHLFQHPTFNMFAVAKKQESPERLTFRDSVIGSSQNLTPNSPDISLGQTLDQPEAPRKPIRLTAVKRSSGSNRELFPPAQKARKTNGVKSSSSPKKATSTKSKKTIQQYSSDITVDYGHFVQLTVKSFKDLLSTNGGLVHQEQENRGH